MATTTVTPSNSLALADAMFDCSTAVSLSPTSDPSFRVRLAGEHEALMASDTIVARAQAHGENPIREALFDRNLISDTMARVRREIALIKATRERQEQNSKAWSELERKANTIEGLVHVAYLQGLQRTMIEQALALAFQEASPALCITVGAAWDAIDRKVEQYCTQSMQAYEMMLSNYDKNLNTAAARISRREGLIVQKIQEQKIEDFLYITQVVRHEAQLLKYALLKQQIAVQGAAGHSAAGGLQIDSSLQDIIRLASNGPIAVGEISKNRWTRLLSMPSQTVRVLTGVETIDTASLSSEERRELAAKMVDLIKDSLAGGGRFNEKENTIEQFEAAFALPGSRLHCIFDQSGKLLGAASIHLDAFPAQQAHLKKRYSGSLRPGLFRVVTIATQLQGTDAYEKLDRRAILDASGRVDFLIGRWRVGNDANIKGSKHIKMGHMPQGQVERTEDGKVFQHLIISVNSHLREVAFKARPKGYLPSEHRAIARQIVDLSSEDESGYTTPSYPELVTGAYDPMLAGWVRRDHSDLDQLYADHPEGLHPRHLLLRFDR